jgi:hypothetical protein
LLIDCELTFVFDCMQTGLLSYVACKSVKINEH